MRYLGIDYGNKRVGLSLCDPNESIVSPLCQLQIETLGQEGFFARLKQVVQEYRVEAVVIGLPLNMDGSEGPQAKLTREFAGRLEQILSIPVHFQDERLSSAAADELLTTSGFSKDKRRDRRDMLAACAILQDFLYRLNDNGTNNT